MAIRRFNVCINGVDKLLLSNNRCSDPLSQEAKDKSHFLLKKKKSHDDLKALRLIDWVQSGYWVNKGKVIIDDVENTIDLDGFSDLTLPSENFARCLRNGATAFKLGKETTRAIVVENEALIQYDGPRTAKEMITNTKFVLTSPVVRKQSTNWVTRIQLPGWSVEYQISIDDDRISVDYLERICKNAGQFEGLGTWRPRYGRFTSELTEIAA